MSYLLRHLAAAGVTFDHRLSLMLLGLSPFFLFYRRRAAPARARCLRVLAFACVVVAGAGLRLTVRLPDKPLHVVAAVDLSDSVGPGAAQWARQYLSRVVGVLAPEDELAVITFAGDVAVAVPPSEPAVPQDLPTPKVRTSTDIAQALSAAMTLLPADGTRRILLLSDGNQTRGDADRLAAHLQTAGVRLDAVVAPAPAAPALALDKVVAPSIVPAESVFPLRIVVRNSARRRHAVLNLFLDGEIVDSRAVPLPPGVTTLDIPHRISAPGSHHLRVELAATDGRGFFTADRTLSVMVMPRTRVLLVTTTHESLLGQVLSRRNFAVQMRRPAHAPRTVDALGEYHCVIFENVTGADVNESTFDAVEAYVREVGGGLVVTGGARTFGDPRLRRSSLQTLLPLTPEPQPAVTRTREPVALVLLIDRSNSMGYNSRIRSLRDGQKLRYAKEAALTVIRQLGDEDLVAAYAFDSRNHEIAALAPLRDNRARLEADLPRVVENGGTDFYESLATAARKLAKAPVRRRHVILLTDGDTNRAAADHDPVIVELARAGITVTTIRIGDDDVNLDLLRGISERTGGEFHHVRNLDLLPELMLRDATQALASRPASERFFPQPGKANAVLLDLADAAFPAVYGYGYSRARPGAEVVLHVSRAGRRDPILAAWQYGLGRVAAFTAATAGDTEEWPAWSEFGRFWAQVVRWAAAQQRPADYALEVRRRDAGVTQLLVRTFDPECTDTAIRARLHVAPEETREIELMPAAPRLFLGRLPDVPGGRYPITILRRHAGGSLSEETATVTIPEESEKTGEEETFSGPNMALLTRLTEATGGRVNPGPGDLGKRTIGTRRKDFSLDGLLLPVAMLAFLGDIAVRRRVPLPPRRSVGARRSARASASHFGTDMV